MLGAARHHCCACPQRLAHVSSLPFSSTAVTTIRPRCRCGSTRGVRPTEPTSL
ncbi:Uncharacterised protein [Bordetella pertussis]|nr:Uncharacterised protein [Bordetella pertussis]CFW48382.1 Uncharacterised protein [Bordetella pertussis]